MRSLLASHWSNTFFHPVSDDACLAKGHDHLAVLADGHLQNDIINVLRSLFSNGDGSPSALGGWLIYEKG